MDNAGQQSARGERSRPRCHPCRGEVEAVSLQGGQDRPATTAKPPAGGTAAPGRDGDPRPRVAYKWVALSVTTLGAAMAAIDSSIVVLGLPTIMTDLHSDLVTMIWVLMSYILMSTIFLMLF